MSVPLVLLQSYPRSGNTIVRHVLEDVYGVKTYTVYPDEDDILWPERHVDPRSGTDEPVAFIKTHESKDYCGISHKTIYIVRDGRDTLISQAHFLAEFNPSCGDVWKKRLRELVYSEDTRLDGVGVNPANNWGAHVSQLMPRADAVLRFEDLLVDPIAEVREALKRVGVLELLPPLPAGVMPTFDELHERNPGFYRSGTAGQWEHSFPESLLKVFWKRHGHAMRLAGYLKGRVPAWA